MVTFCQQHKNFSVSRRLDVQRFSLANLVLDILNSERKLNRLLINRSLKKRQLKNNTSQVTYSVSSINNLDTNNLVKRISV